MKTTFTCLVLLCMHLAGAAQEWSLAQPFRCYDPGLDYSPGLAVDASGDVFVSALFNDSVSIGGRSFHTPYNTTESYIARLTPGYALKWIQFIGSGFVTKIEASENFIFVLGHFHGLLEFPDTTVSGPSEWTDFLVCYDKLGQRKWIRTLEYHPYTQLTADRLGNVTAGNSRGTNKGFFLKRFDASGNITLDYSYRSSGDYLCLAQTPSLNYVAVDITYFASMSVAMHTIDYRSGNITRSDSIQGVMVNKLIADKLGNLYLLGDLTREQVQFLDKPVAMDDYYRTSTTRHEPFIAKINPTHTCAWLSKNLGFTASDIKSTGEEVYVTALFQDSLTYGDIRLQGNPVGFFDCILKLDTAGRGIWGIKDTAKYASPLALCLLQVTGDALYITGMYENCICDLYFGASVLPRSCSLATYLVKATDHHASPPTGIHAPGQAGDVTLWPNPSKGSFVLQLPGHTQEKVSTISIRNSQGQTVQRLKLPNAGSRIGINLDGVPAGLYFLEIETTGATVVRKILLE